MSGLRKNKAYLINYCLFRTNKAYLLEDCLYRTNKAHLIKDGLVRTNKAPLEHLLLTIRISHRVANMEQLTIIRYISIVAIGATITSKLVHNILTNRVGVCHQAKGGRDGVLGGAILIRLSLE